MQSGARSYLPLAPDLHRRPEMNAGQKNLQQANRSSDEMGSDSSQEGDGSQDGDSSQEGNGSGQGSGSGNKDLALRCLESFRKTVVCVDAMDLQTGICSVPVVSPGRV
jgi:hypothetical protein